MKSYDLLLVMGYFRSAAAFLPIIRHLSKDFCIGLLPIEPEENLKKKTENAAGLFLDLCRGFGAEIVLLGEEVETKVLLVHQFPYDEEKAVLACRSIHAQKRIAMMTLAMAGIEKHDQFLELFDLKKAHVPDEGLASYLIGKRGAEERYAKVERVEVGLPFLRNPVFPEFKADWIFAAPTLFSFHAEAEKQAFLRAVLSLFKEIPPEDDILYKGHNSHVMDYFAPRAHYALAKILRFLSVSEEALIRLASRVPASLRRHLLMVATSLLHLKILRRARPMRSATPYADLALELFLPGVRKGVIGGLSNTIWGAMASGLPFYNCVDPSLRAEKSELFNKNADALLGLNLGYFGVPYCEGRLAKGARLEKVGRLADGKTPDLVALLREELLA